MTDAESDASLAHTGPDAPLAYFSSAPNSPLKVDLDPRQAYFIFFFFTITHLFICLGSYFCHHCDRVLDRVYIAQAPRNSQHRLPRALITGMPPNAGLDLLSIVLCGFISLQLTGYDKSDNLEGILK